MTFVLADQGKIQLLQKILKVALTANENYILKLFANDYTPDQSSAPGSFTEASFTNYAARTLTRTNWSAAVITERETAESSYGIQPVAWTCGTTGNSLYGYWIEGATSGKVLWAERFVTCREFGETDVLRITPKLALGIIETNVLTETDVDFITEDGFDIVSET